MPSKADIRKRFTKQVAALKDASEAAAKVVTAGEAPKQLKLDKNGWDGNVLDPANMGKPFDRAEHDDDVSKAVSNPDSPGVVGDLAVSTLQGDFLAAFERSQRLRHATPVRLTIHAAARKYGHGHDAGVLVRGLQAYLTGILKVSKKANG